jgi:hypothetical protein
VRASPLGETFRPGSPVNQNAGVGNNWAKGHYLRQRLGKRSAEPPCSLEAFVVNLEHRTVPRPSVRVCVGPELARCGHMEKQMHPFLMSFELSQAK